MFLTAFLSNSNPYSGNSNKTTKGFDANLEMPQKTSISRACLAPTPESLIHTMVSQKRVKRAVRSCSSSIRRNGLAERPILCAVAGCYNAGGQTPQTTSPLHQWPLNPDVSSCQGKGRDYSTCLLCLIYPTQENSSSCGNGAVVFGNHHRGPRLCCAASFRGAELKVSFGPIEI